MNQTGVTHKDQIVALLAAADGDQPVDFTVVPPKRANVTECGAPPALAWAASAAAGRLTAVAGRTQRWCCG